MHKDSQIWFSFLWSTGIAIFFFKENYLLLINLKFRLAQHNFLFTEGDFNELNIHFAKRNLN